MKKRISSLLVLFLAIGATQFLLAQDELGKTVNTSRSNIKNNTTKAESNATCKGKLVFTDGACELTMTNNVVTAREAGSGMATGKRQHKPLVITKELDKSTPQLRESPTKSSGGKVSVQDLSVTVSVKGVKKRLQVMNNEFTLPDDCDDQDCDLVVSWSWGQTQAGSAKRETLSAVLEMQNGECVAIKTKGTGADKD